MARRGSSARRAPDPSGASPDMRRTRDVEKVLRQHFLNNLSEHGVSACRHAGTARSAEPGICLAGTGDADSGSPHSLPRQASMRGGAQNAAIFARGRYAAATCFGIERLVWVMRLLASTYTSVGLNAAASASLKLAKAARMTMSPGCARCAALP